MMMINLKKYIAEAIGTFLLAGMVFLTLHSNAASFAPLLAGIMLGFVVYTIGSISGAHINPAVTLGVLSVGKISPKNALWYIVAQFVGALLALGIGAYFVGAPLSLVQVSTGLSLKVFLAEAFGAFVFVFGIASVIYEKPHNAMNGAVIGTALLLGGLIASLGTSYGFLNPAVAFANGSLNVVYGLAPIVGSVVAMNFYKFLAKA